MRVLFDQGTPVPLRQALAGHSVFTTYELGWATLKNGELLRSAEEQGFEVLVTTDTNLRYQQNLAARQIAVVVLSTTSWPRIRVAVALVASRKFSIRRQLCRSFRPINPGFNPDFTSSPRARRRPRNPKIIHRGDICEKNTTSPLPGKTPTQHSSKNKSPSGSMKSPSHTLRQSLRRLVFRTKASSTVFAGLCGFSPQAQSQLEVIPFDHVD